MGKSVTTQAAVTSEAIGVEPSAEAAPAVVPAKVLACPKHTAVRVPAEPVDGKPPKCPKEGCKAELTEHVPAPSHPVPGTPVVLLLAKPVSWEEEFADGTKVVRSVSEVAAVVTAMGSDGAADLKVIHPRKGIVRMTGVPRGTQVVEGKECWRPEG